MKLDGLIRMIDNKEYVSVESDGICNLTWYDMRLKNGDLVRIEKCHRADGEADSFMVLYATPNEKTFEIWNGDYRDNSYYIFSNIFNELERKFK